MSAPQKFYEGLNVEVWIERRGEWVRGQVLQCRTNDDGTNGYFIQLSGYMAMSPSDPNAWFAEGVIRAAGY